MSYFLWEFEKLELNQDQQNNLKSFHIVDEKNVGNSVLASYSISPKVSAILGFGITPKPKP